jgi:hypothetical protein
MGIGLSVVATGLLLVAVLETVSPGTVPAFGPFDLFFVTGYLLAIAGIASLPQLATDWSQRLRALLDGLIGAIAVGVISWVLLLEGVFRQVQQLNFWERYLGMAYPLLDVLSLTVIMTVIVRRSAYRFDVRLAFLIVGFGLQAIADISFLRSGLGKTFEAAQPVWPVNIGALTAFFLGALMVRLEPRRVEFAERNGRLLSVLAPYSAAVFMVGFMLWNVVHQDRDGEFWILLAGPVVVAILVIARQSIAIRENRVILERQRAALVSSAIVVAFFSFGRAVAAWSATDLPGAARIAGRINSAISAAARR